MACGHEPWIQARNSNEACFHPPIAHCTQCRAELCSAHLIECEICEHFICSDCVVEHYKEHERKTRQIGRAA